MTMNNNMNAYSFYKIGDTFHNDNGDDYIILNLSESRNKALLAKILDKKETKITKSPALFIGAKGLRMTDWQDGHYFMGNFKAAVDWFETDDTKEASDKKNILVGDIFNLNHENHTLHFVDVAKNPNEFCICNEYRWLPQAILEAEVLYFEITVEEQFPGDSEFQYPMIHIYLSSKINPEISKYMGTME